MYNIITHRSNPGVNGNPLRAHNLTQMVNGKSNKAKESTMAVGQIRKIYYLGIIDGGSLNK